MGNFITISLRVIVILIILGISFFIVQPLLSGGGDGEMRVYVRIFIITQVVMAFATLRLYNSIVANTRFNIKLRDAVTKLQQGIPTIERANKNLNSSVGNLISAIATLVKALVTNAEKKD